VGRQLNVGRVLEGSLQRSADKIRVNVQLIDTRSNAHVWASSYDRKLDDVFAVETEIANTIAQQLDATLVQRISTKRPTANPAAYNAYLRGLGIEHSQSSGGLSYEDSATAYAEAVQLDPNFGLAWARLSIVRSFLYYHGVDPNVNSAAAVKETADRALALAPELGEAWLAQGTYRSRVLNDPDAALQAYREAERRLPNSALVREYMAYAERRLDRWREAEAHLVRAIELDPGNTRLWTNLASDILWPLGRAAEAHAAYDRALEVSPNNEFVIALKAAQYQQEGRLGEAAKELARIPRDSTDKAVLIHRVDQAVLERNFDEAIYWAKKATSSPSPGQAHNTQDIFALVLQGYCELWASHHEDARTTFERVIHEVAPGGVLRAPPILGSRIYLAVAYAGLGDKSNAHEQASQGVAEYKNDALLKPIADAFRARTLAQLGEVDAAIDALPHLLEIPGGIHPGDLRYSPYWDPLRNNPRFEELLKNPPPVRY
jgi:tetratricopeptide (TPR) repeat protein